MHNTLCKTKPFPLCKFNLVCNEFYKYAGMYGYFSAVRKNSTQDFEQKISDTLSDHTYAVDTLYQ